MHAEKFNRESHQEMCTNIDALFAELDGGTLDLGAIALGTPQNTAPEVNPSKRLGHPGAYDVQADKIAHFGSHIFPKPF